MDNEARHIPAHVAIIMDGNGRWAKMRGMPRVAGHQAGMKALERTIDHAKNIGIRYLSVYAFSTENWKRSRSEVLGLMGLFRYYLRGKLDKMDRNGARVRMSGKAGDLSEDIQRIFSQAEEKTKDNTAIDIIICVNYGGRQEILDAAQKMRESGYDGPMTEEAMRKFLYLPDVPDPDLLIRTGGELRISNFLTWQSAYTEMYFSDLFWPDFGPDELDRAIASFAGRERRYGTA